MLTTSSVYSYNLCDKIIIGGQQQPGVQAGGTFSPVDQYVLHTCICGLFRMYDSCCHLFCFYLHKFSKERKKGGSKGNSASVPVLKLPVPAVPAAAVVSGGVGPGARQSRELLLLTDPTHRLQVWGSSAGETGYRTPDRKSGSELK